MPLAAGFTPKAQGRGLVFEQDARRNGYPVGLFDFSAAIRFFAGTVWH